MSGGNDRLEISSELDVPPVEIETALWDLVACGRVGADGFQALRSLLGAREGRAKGRAETRARRVARKRGRLTEHTLPPLSEDTGQGTRGHDPKRGRGSCPNKTS